MARIYRVVNEVEYNLCKREENIEKEKIDKIEIVLKYLNPKHRAKGERLLQALSASGDITWKNNGQFLYRGKVVEGANIVDLISFSVKRLLPSQVGSNRLPGLQYYLQAIKDNFLPRELFSPHIHAMLLPNPTDISKPVAKSNDKNMKWKRFKME